MTLSKKLKAVLKSLAPMLRDSGRMIQIECYAWDEKNPALPTSWELSALRATQALRYLVESAGLPANQLSAHGKGVRQGATAKDPGANRRVEIYIVTNEVGEADPK